MAKHPNSAFAALAALKANLKAQANIAATVAAAPSIKPIVEDAFARAMYGIQPLQHNNQAQIKTKKPVPLPRQQNTPLPAIPADALADSMLLNEGVDIDVEMHYVQAGQDPKILRKLQQGHWGCQGEADFHDYSTEQARQYFATFLSQALQEKMRCVRLIHGKGLSSKHRMPIIKQQIRHWLMQRPEILAFCPAKSAEGGAGVVLVLLAKSTC
jgi:DNA-nicking Smr family endonuclease